MNCPVCGAVLEEDAIFCTVCGEKINARTSAELPVATKFCKYCREKIPAEAVICPACGGKLGKKAFLPKTVLSDGGNRLELPKTEQGKNWIKEHKKAVLIVGAALLVLLVILMIPKGKKCQYSGCRNKAVEGSSYCYSHKCSFSDCPNMIYSRGYCYTHYLLYDKSVQEAIDKYTTARNLKISDVKLENNSSYTIATGSLKNNGSSKVTFVKVKGSFKDFLGNVIDTDWTYACGSEGLDPGESVKFRLSVDKDYKIKDVEISIID